MDENEVKNQQLETPEYEVTNEEQIEDVRPADVVFRHPHQILTNKEIQLLLQKQAWLERQKEARKKRGEDEEGAEELTPTEKSAVDLFILRARHQHSKPKKLNAKQRTAKKLKRRMTNKSRKANRA